MGGSVSCGTCTSFSSRSEDQKSGFDGGFGRKMQVRLCSFGKYVPQREGIVVYGYVTAGGKGFRPVCKSLEGWEKRFWVLFCSE